MPTGPVRVPRRRPSGAPDDIAHLSLDEVRDRLARNERVLGSALFSTSPTTPRGSSPISTMNPMDPAQGPGYRQMQGNTDDDPVRDRLLAVREALKARESELLANSVSNINLDAAPLATSPPTRSGKARALETIRATEATRGSNGISLPIQQSLDLGTRDFEDQTAARLENMSLNSTRKPRRHRHIDDELGRAASAAQYARAHVDDTDDDMFDTDEAYAAASVYASDRHDAGNGLPLTTAKASRAEDFDEDMRSDSDEDESNFLEGNDEYEGDGTDTMDAAPS